MSDLISELDSLARESWTIRTPCHTGRLLESMEPDVRAKVQELLDNPAVVSASLATVLRKWGYEVSYSSLTRHRRRGSNRVGCSCP